MAELQDAEAVAANSTEIKENTFQQEGIKAFSQLMEVSETMPYAKISVVETPGIITKPEMGPGMLGHTPLPEKYMQVKAALKGDTIPQATKHSIQPIEHPGIVEEEMIEIDRNIPQTQVIVCMKANVETLLSADKKALILSQFQDSVQLYKELAEMSQEQTTGMTLKVLVQVETVAGTVIVPFPDQTAEGIHGLISSTETHIEAMLNDFPAFYEDKLKQSLGLPDELQKRDVLTHDFMSNVKSVDFQRYLTRKYLIPPHKLGSSNTSYMPASMIIALGKTIPQIEAFPGKALTYQSISP